MYKNLNDRLILSTRRNKTESKYLSNFIDWLEHFEKRSNPPENLMQVIDLLNRHRYIHKFTINFSNSATWTSGTIASVYLNISNKAFKLPVVTFIQNYNPRELSKEESEKYIQKLKSAIKPTNQ